MSDSPNKTPLINTDTETSVATIIKPKLNSPQMYAVVMHNDNYTTMDFVVQILMEVFEQTLQKSVDLMMQIHTQGSAVVALLPYQIAEMKVEEATMLAEESEFPLLITLEKQ